MRSFTRIIVLLTTVSLLRVLLLSVSLLSVSLLSVSLLSVSLLSACAPSLRPDPSAATRAEQYASEGKYEEAIAAYREHIKRRLMDPKRPKTENPHFYLLLIGDLYLKSGRTELAREAYEQARDKEVDRALTVERLRRFATHFEEQNDLDRAFLELKRYRELDPLMFDSEIDRLHKLFIARERQKETDID